METKQRWMTAEELLYLPDDGMRHELVDGELRTMTPSGSEHSVISATLAHLVRQFVTARGLGLVLSAEAGFKIRSNPDTVRAPDLAFIRRERIPATGIPKGYWPGAPDLAAEVVSPNDTYEEVDEKVREWLEAGTGAVWVVNPRRRTVTLFLRGGEARLLSEHDTLGAEPALPGFTCRVADLFP